MAIISSKKKTDQIAFLENFIKVPTDSLYTLKLFNETPDFRTAKPFLISGEKIAFGYEGDYEDMRIKLISETPEGFSYRITKDQKTDTLYYWYKPRLKVDSLQFKVSHPSAAKDYTVFIREQKRDTLIINSEPSGTIRFEEPFKISANTPFVAFNDHLVNILDQNSTRIEFTHNYDSITNAYHLNFKKTEDNTYRIQALPEAFIDFFDHKNDTLNYVLKTRKESDYGYVRFTLVNAKYPLIFQLTDAKGDVKYEQYATEAKALDFLNLDSGKYFIRVIFDANGNGKYDPGNFLKKIQPERVAHFEMDDEIRSDWGLVQTLNFIE